MNRSAKQRGLVTVEFALIGAFFFFILFTIIEFGRLLFTWNTLDEVTRRAARLAAVCPIDETAAVINRSIFQGTVINGLTSANVSVEYLDENFNSSTSVQDIRYVRSSIQNYQHQLLIPFLPTDILTAPDFSTTLPSESLGTTPTGSWSVTCL